MVNFDSTISQESLLEKFNERDKSVFAQVYISVFDEINHFATRLFYYSNVDSKDLIQDVFVTIWSNKSLKFISLSHVKNYLYLAIKNKYKNDLKHNKYVKEYQILSEDSVFSTMIESKTLSILSEALSMLPDDCAEIFKLYIDGWDIKEIAVKLDKSESSIYSKRNEGIKMLRKRLINNQFVILINLFS